MINLKALSFSVLSVFLFVGTLRAEPVAVLTYAGGQILTDNAGNIYDPWGHVMISNDGKMNYPRWPGEDELPLRRNVHLGSYPWVTYYPDRNVPEEKRILADRMEIYYPMGPNDQNRFKLSNGPDYSWDDGSAWAPTNWTATPTSIYHKRTGVSAWRDGQLNLPNGQRVTELNMTEGLGENSKLGLFNLFLENDLGTLKMQSYLVLNLFSRWDFFMYPIIFENSDGLPKHSTMSPLLTDFYGYIFTGYDDGQQFEVLRYHVKDDQVGAKLMLLTDAPPQAPGVPSDWPIPECVRLLARNPALRPQLRRPLVADTHGFVQRGNLRP